MDDGSFEGFWDAAGEPGTTEADAMAGPHASLLASQGFEVTGWLGIMIGPERVLSAVWQDATRTTTAGCDTLYGVPVLSFTTVAEDGRVVRTCHLTGWIPQPGARDFATFWGPALQPTAVETALDLPFPIEGAFPRSGLDVVVVREGTADSALRQHRARVERLGGALYPLTPLQSGRVDIHAGRVSGGLLVAGTDEVWVPMCGLFALGFWFLPDVPWSLLLGETLPASGAETVWRVVCCLMGMIGAWVGTVLTSRPALRASLWGVTSWGSYFAAVATLGLGMYVLPEPSLEAWATLIAGGLAAMCLAGMGCVAVAQRVILPRARARARASSAPQVPAAELVA